MSASILHPHEWNQGTVQPFLSVSPGRDEMTLHESNYENNAYTLTKVASRSELDFVQCYSYSPTNNGLVCAGLLSGSSLLFDIRDSMSSHIKLRPKHARPCNAVSFSSNGMLAIGLDKVRNDHCLQIWTIDRVSQGDKEALKSPTYSLLPSDVIISISFLPQIPSSLLCGSYKFLREFDLRSQSPSVQLATKCVRGISVDAFNQNYFSSHSEDGTVCFWDRRLLRSGDPLLVLNPVWDNARGKNAFPPIRVSHTRRGEFSLLQDGNTIKRWQTGHVPTHKEPAEARSRQDGFTSLETFAHQPYALKPECLFVSSVTQTTTDSDRVVSFDYVKDIANPYSVNFVCIRQGGQVFRMKVTESSSAIKFDPYNSIAIVDPDRVSLMAPKFTKLLPSSAPSDTESLAGRRPSQVSQQSFSTLADEDYLEDDRQFGEGLVNPFVMLGHDISTTIRNLAIQGYGMDCETNIKLLNQENSHPKLDHLLYTWRWLLLARNSATKESMMAGPLDLSYEGVLGIWEGYPWIASQYGSNAVKKMTEVDYTNSIDKILEGSKRTIFTSYISPNKTKRALRQLCLRVAGWNFEISQLEEKLQDLQKRGLYAQAAGWAVFHGDVPRAVEALAASRSQRNQMMSTAVAGYLAYKNTTVNSPWRDLCRKMATDLDDPYMKAVFAFISDGEWMDVLDNTSLPLHERLGIALRFLADNELSQYLNSLTSKAIAHGELDGVILTGITPRAVDLLQSYVDKTCDVQTASLIISYGAPKYFQDYRTNNWVECYRNLLNSWRLFGPRAMFDVARSKYSKNRDGQITAQIVPRQVFLRCNHCKKVIGTSSSVPSKEHIPKRKSNQIKMQSTEPSIKCSFCSNPLPRCAICLLPLGSFSRTKPIHDSRPKQISQDDANKVSTGTVKAVETGADHEKDSNFAKWFTFCLSCNHGIHAAHVEEWFSKHNVCPIPDCNCNCSQYTQ